MNDSPIAISLKRFLLIEKCPEAWKDLDLYLFRDKELVFYVGQSNLAFGRVWEHLLNGFKGHSPMGRFLWCNWPKSMNFTIELLSSMCEQFTNVGNNINEAERLLIQRWSPCFNVTHNRKPTPFPATYWLPNARQRRRRSLNALIREAARAVKAEENRLRAQEN